jgi:hypothetical protein
MPITHLANLLDSVSSDSILVSTVIDFLKPLIVIQWLVAKQDPRQKEGFSNKGDSVTPKGYSAFRHWW